MVQPPSALINRYRSEFLAQFPLVRDGSPDAIHLARVATRRLREVLPLADAAGSRPIESAVATARSIGRTLGRVRELDVMADLFGSLEVRLPAVAGVAATARAHLTGDQRRARKEMIKSLDQLDLASLNVGTSRLQWPFGAHRWQPRLMTRIKKLGGEVAQSMDHAGGIYLPNRSHRLRVAVKKLRYAMEAASAAGVWKDAPALEVLKQAQGTLGDLHDLHVAQQRLESDQQLGALRAQATILIEMIAAEIDRRQRRFLRMRPGLLAVARDCAGLRRPALATPRRPLLITAAVVPGLAILAASALTQDRQSVPIRKSS